MQMKLANSIRKSRKLSRSIERRLLRPTDSKPASLAMSILLVKGASITKEPEWASGIRPPEVLVSEAKEL